MNRRRWIIIAAGILLATIIGIIVNRRIVYSQCDPCVPKTCDPCDDKTCDPCVPKTCDPCVPKTCDPCDDKTYAHYKITHWTGSQVLGTTQTKVSDNIGITFGTDRGLKQWIIFPANINGVYRITIYWRGNPTKDNMVPPTSGLNGEPKTPETNGTHVYSWAEGNGEAASRGGLQDQSLYDTIIRFDGTSKVNQVVLNTYPCTLPGFVDSIPGDIIIMKMADQFY